MEKITKLDHLVILKMKASLQNYGGENTPYTLDDWLLSSSQSPQDCPSYQIQYSLDSQDHPTLYPGLSLSIKHTGQFQCTSCHKLTKKIISGFCYYCLHKKACADLCVMNPHLCHYANNTCREPQWGESFCFQPHYVYVSYTDKYKVGITRHTHILSRWVDQGATMGAVVCKTTSRFQAGMIENSLKQILADKTHWQKMLKSGNSRPTPEEFTTKILDVKKWIQNTLELNSQIIISPTNTPLEDAQTHPEGNKITFFETPHLINLNFPVPEKIHTIKSVSLEKEKEIHGVITGIKGQYIFFGDRVINMRSHEGFIVDLEYCG